MADQPGSGDAAAQPQGPDTLAPVRDTHSGVFLRLSQLWAQRSHFSLVLAIVDNPAYRDALIRRLDALQAGQRVDLDDATSPAPWLAQAQTATSGGFKRLHLCLPLGRRRTDRWWQQANVLRERLGEALPGVQLLWLSAADADAAAHQAPDLWNWREAVFSFAAEAVPTAAPQCLAGTRFDGISGTDAQALALRLAQIEAYLAAQGEPDLATAHLALEAARGHARLGRWGQATAAAEHAAAWFEAAGDASHAAAAKLELAGLVWHQGEPEQALHMLNDEVLPVYERLGDLRAKAVTMGQIADILQARGQLDEALRIRQQKELPVYERLGDARSKAVALYKVAEIHAMQGKAAVALASLTDQVSPVFARLGLVREADITRHWIAELAAAAVPAQDA